MRAKTRRQEISVTINLLRPAAADVGCSSQYGDLRHCTPDAIGPAVLTSHPLSSLLWSACQSPFVWPNYATGARGKVEGAAHIVDLYLAMADVIYFCSPHSHQLMPTTYGDLREGALVAEEPPVRSVPPVQLIYVADLRGTRHIGSLEESVADSDLLKFYGASNAGLIGGRVLQFAASHRLVTWFHGSDREWLDRALSIGTERRLLFVQERVCSRLPMWCLSS
jgi:hypothetical protein